MVFSSNRINQISYEAYKMGFTVLFAPYFYLLHGE